MARYYLVTWKFILRAPVGTLTRMYLGSSQSSDQSSWLGSTVLSILKYSLHSLKSPNVNRVKQGPKHI